MWLIWGCPVCEPQYRQCTHVREPVSQNEAAMQHSGFNHGGFGHSLAPARIRLGVADLICMSCTHGVKYLVEWPSGVSVSRANPPSLSPTEKVQPVVRMCSEIVLASRPSGTVPIHALEHGGVQGHVRSSCHGNAAMRNKFDVSPCVV